MFIWNPIAQRKHLEQKIILSEYIITIMLKLSHLTDNLSSKTIATWLENFFSEEFF